VDNRRPLADAAEGSKATQSAERTADRDSTLSNCEQPCAGEIERRALLTTQYDMQLHLLYRRDASTAPLRSCRTTWKKSCGSTVFDTAAAKQYSSNLNSYPSSDRVERIYKIPFFLTGLHHPAWVAAASYRFGIARLRYEDKPVCSDWLLFTVACSTFSCPQHPRSRYVFSIPSGGHRFSCELTVRQN
jgi:hypothetical protein